MLGVRQLNVKRLKQKSLLHRYTVRTTTMMEINNKKKGRSHNKIKGKKKSNARSHRTVDEEINNDSVFLKPVTLRRVGTVLLLLLFFSIIVFQ